MTGSSLPAARRLGEVAAVLLERLVLLLGVLRRDAVAAPHLGQRCEHLLAGGAVETLLRRRPLLVGHGQREQQVLGREVVVVQLGRVLRRGLEDRGRAPSRWRLAAVRLGQTRQRLLGAVPQRQRVEPDLADDRQDHAVVLRKQGDEQVVGGDLGVARPPMPSRSAAATASWVFSVQVFGSRLMFASFVLRCRAPRPPGARVQGPVGTAGGCRRPWPRPRRGCARELGFELGDSPSSSSTRFTPARLRPSLVSSWMRRSCSMSASL